MGRQVGSRRQRSTHCRRRWLQGRSMMKRTLQRRSRIQKGGGRAAAVAPPLLGGGEDEFGVARDVECGSTRAPFRFCASGWGAGDAALSAQRRVSDGVRPRVTREVRSGWQPRWLSECVLPLVLCVVPCRKWNPSRGAAAGAAVCDTCCGKPFFLRSCKRDGLRSL